MHMPSFDLNQLKNNTLILCILQAVADLIATDHTLTQERLCVVTFKLYLMFVCQ